MNSEHKVSPWCFGLEEDEYFMGADSEEDAMSEGQNHAKDCGQKYFYIGKTKALDLKEMSYLSGDSIIESLTGNEDNFEHLTEDAAEEWLSKVTPEQEEELEAKVKETLIAWLTKHNLEPKCFKVIEARRIELSDGY